MKKIMALFMAALAAVCFLSSCGSGADTARTKKLQIVTTVFPAYDWTKEILGDKAEGAELTLLCDSGADLHSYQPTAADMLKISDADVFIYVGGESDRWAEDAVSSGGKKGRVTVRLLSVLGDTAKKEETVEGMQAEDETEDGEEEYDEHVWLSLRNAREFCAAIADALGEADPDNGLMYWTNETAYDEKLSALDAKYRETVKASAGKTLLFGDRFPFRYLADDYGLKYYAAFPGCSAETDASFETVAFLARKMDELRLGTVLTIEKSDESIARAIIENTGEKNQRILTLDSMQAASAKDGISYLSVMEKNLGVLRDALE